MPDGAERIDLLINLKMFQSAFVNALKPINDTQRVVLTARASP